MRLKKRQKEIALKWVAEGLDTAEINQRASLFDEPFDVSRQQVDYYRKSRKTDMKEMRQLDENKALNEGLAIKAVRVEKLKALAERLYSDLMDDGLTWTEEVKGIGSGPIAEIVEYLEFNRSEIDAYRGLLDDIAREIGDRSQKHEVTGKDGDSLVLEFKQRQPTDED